MDVTSAITWRKSTKSGNNGGACVEIGTATDSPVVLIRDTKDRERGMLTVHAAAWRRFTENIKLADLPRAQISPRTNRLASGG